MVCLTYIICIFMIVDLGVFNRVVFNNGVFYIYHMIVYLKAKTTLFFVHNVKDLSNTFHCRVVALWPDGLRRTVSVEQG